MIVGPMKDYKLKLRNLLVSHTRLSYTARIYSSLSHTELVLELEHLEIETRSITEMIANVMGEYVFLK